jgi:hypothetical protein
MMWKLAQHRQQMSESEKDGGGDSEDGSDGNVGDLSYGEDQGQQAEFA